MSAPNRRVSVLRGRAPVRLRSRPGRPRGAVPTGFAPHAVEVAGLLHEVSVRLLGADNLTSALERLTALTAGAVRGAVRCSVVLIGEGGPLTHTGHGAAGRGFDEVQYATGAGPGLDAARTRTLITVPDLAGDPRWPGLAGRADGVRSVVAIPLDVPKAEVGSLSVYLDRVGGLGPERLLTAMALVNQAEVLLGELRRRDHLAGDAAIDRAVGVIIAQRGCGVREAYDVLSETAQHLGLDRRAVAERLVAVAARNAEGLPSRTPEAQPARPRPDDGAPGR